VDLHLKGMEALGANITIDEGYVVAECPRGLVGEEILLDIASVGATSFIAALAPQFALVCIIVLTAIYFSFAFLTDSAAVRVMDTGRVQDEEILDLDENFANVVSIVGSEHSKRAGGS
jgi:hypothetical protein